MRVQTWDVNKPAPESLGGPFNLMLASNAVHTCDNMAGDSLLFSHTALHNTLLQQPQQGDMSPCGRNLWVLMDAAGGQVSTL